MSFRSMIYYIIGIFISFGVGAQETELLKKEDISRIMQQILKQHVQKKEMTTDLLQNGVKVFIDQFDPNHIYLMQHEVQPYLQLSPFKAQSFLQDYQRNDWTVFSNLNTLFQKAILRARKIRKDLERNPNSIVYQTQNLPGEFPVNEEQLRTQINNDLAQFLISENRRGDNAKIITLYENQMHEHEDPYLTTAQDGHTLPDNEQESLFALHVLKALASGLDVHTGVLNPREAEMMRMKLEMKFEGVGLHLMKKGNEIVITGLIAGSPADKSKLISVNDRLIEIDNHKVQGIPMETVLEWLRGDQNTKVDLALKRNNDPNLIRVQLTREDIPINEGRVQSSYQKYEDGIIGKIVIHAFYEGNNGVSTESDTKAAIEKLRKKGNLLGLILDLRDNNGGFLLQAVKVVGLFITEGVVVISKYSNGDEHFYRDTDNKEIYAGPLVILTSKETASAAEIVTQALQDYGVGIVVGDEHTFGKGTVQNQTITNYNNDASSFFKVTVGKYYTVSGRTPQLRGVQADIVVPSYFSHEPIGEEYLGETITPDTIPAAYSDPLSDIPPRLKSWYQQYYSTNLQQKEKRWQLMVPELKKRSEGRLERNRNYTKLIQEERAFTDSDPQMQEAVNILEDMIQLEKR